jgi:hypothetical protein
MPTIKSFENLTFLQKTISTPSTAEILFAAVDTDQIMIKAFNDNVDIVYIGESGVDDTNGTPLFAGDTLTLEVDQNKTALYAWSASSGEKLSIIHGVYRIF